MSFFKKVGKLSKFLPLILTGIILGSAATWFATSFDSQDSAYWVPPLESQNFKMGFYGKYDNGVSNNIGPIFSHDLQEGNVCSIDPHSFLKSVWPKVKDTTSENPDMINVYGCKEFILTKGKIYFVKTDNHDILVYVYSTGSTEIIMQTSMKYPANHIDEVKIYNNREQIYLVQEGWNNPAKLLTFEPKQN